MHLVQLLLPLHDNDGNAFPGTYYREVRDLLVEKFGGLTAYTRAPVRGLWQGDGDAPVQDDLVIYEVMVDGLDTAWWQQYRATLERRFLQQSLVVRAQPMTML